jgi:predicted MPP superfamily phosphohydrolase
VTAGRAAAALAAAGLVGWAAWIEPRSLVVRRRTLHLPHWPRTLDGLRVGVMTDLHSGVPHAGLDAIRRWVAAMNAEAPDLIALVGDYADAHFVWGGRLAPEPVAAELAALRAPLGRFAVLGNHDWKQFGSRAWTALEHEGLTVLENRSTAVEARGVRLHVAGVADTRIRRPDVAAALAAVPPGEPVVLLSHDPDLFPEVPARVALTLSGHTHGGQIAIPVLRRLAIPSRYGERYVRGHVAEHGRHLYVSSGLGTSAIPVRLFAPPEIVVLELRAEEPGG